MTGLRRWLWTAGTVALHIAFASSLDVADTILVLAPTQYAADSATSGLQGYGIPFQSIIVPQGGITLPTLNSSTSGYYGGIITVSELSYEYPTGWDSAITAAQWQQLYNYQTTFGVRMVRIDAWPQSDFGTDVAIPDTGCCDNGAEQLVKLTDDTYFKTANLKLNQGVSTIEQWHVPAVITAPTTTKKFAAFAPSGQWTTETVAGVINTFGTRQQMVWFMTWATDWALGPNYLQHASIHFLTRGLFTGARKVHLNTQVDDIHLYTDLYQPTGTQFRVRTGDLDAHITWQTDLNSRLASGSSYFIELAHNGAGDLEAAKTKDTAGICVPDTYVLTGNPATTPLEFVKPLGTGQDYWKAAYTSYSWTLQCAKLDTLATWFTTAAKRNAFAHLSHTYTHLNLNNATYSDAAKEIMFNRQWMAQLGIDQATRYSTKGLVPPNISGMHNGDVIKAWMDNNITYVVGDNTRSPLRNSQNSFWPRTTTVNDDGYAGLITIPRWATSIYYNCDFANCTLQEWIDTSNGAGDFQTGLLGDARTTNVKYLLGLHGDPFMFHQANLRQTDAPTFTVGTKTGRMSLLQIWVETIAQEMIRLTKWPITSLKHDDIGKFFVDRMARDGCNPHIRYNLSNSRTITSVTVTTNGNTCSVPIPVSFPGTATTSSGGTTVDKVGAEPTIIWTTMTGSPVTFTLGTPVAL
ncbi:hypothetical protein GQ53DRAFT_431806 [Thozetella sp. PMI_491]|nr:hypothetical protein GQ53DRAFT_431806 [Thozetella sp. PMI_491]